MNFAEILNALMKKRGVNQAYLFDKTGIDRSTISRYCAGKVEPTLNNAALIAKALGVSIDTLAGIKAAPRYMTNEQAKLNDDYLILDERDRDFVETMVTALAAKQKKEGDSG